jgi:DNA primase
VFTIKQESLFTISKNRCSRSTRITVHDGREYPPVSTPLFWEELSDKIEDNSYTIKTLPQRLAKLKEDPWKDFWKIKQSLRLDKL